ncbi:cold-regulated 413 plasma membrane protein 2-like [Ananas comosus]|uniref:Cold-regulated 413 plasma membrane protein 2-like n=1 Tax=Ananas comosus TaxID=4615 RepID=A0A6P5FI40_ANACO|nr:cold-regulated 413 plasma membrane protein 2-like [Ananas comosus]
MGKMTFIAMKTDEIGGGGGGGFESDLKELGAAARRLVHHALRHGSGVGFATTFLKFLASCAAIYLLILDRTNWRTKMQTSLLIPYIFLSLPSVLFYFLRGEVGKWIAFVAVVLRLFFPRHFPDWLEMPGSLLILLVVAPGFLADTVRCSIVGVMICLFIGCYLLQEHIRASGGFRNALTKSHGISNTLGIVLLLAYPTWFLVLYFL